MNEKDKIRLPIVGTKYWYIQADIKTGKFKVKDTEWVGGTSDKFRFVRNFFSTYREALEAERLMNATLKILEQPTDKKLIKLRGSSKSKLINLNNEQL